MNGKGLAVILVLMFLVAIAAGGVAGGIVVSRWQKPTQTQEPVVRRGTLAEELQLTRDQNRQMQEIWQPISNKSNDWVADSKAVQVEEDKALMDHILVTDEQKLAFQMLRTESAAKIERLELERKAAFDKAVKDTRAILNKEQRTIYDQVINDKLGTSPNSAGSRASEKRDFGNSSWQLAVE